MKSVTVGVFKDLREKRGMERELRKTREALLQSEKLAAMGRLTSQIAHELNNPIYGIMNTLELLKTEVPPESKRRRILELSLSETVRLSEMLRSMLSFSKPEEEKRMPVKINELIEGILLVMEKQMREANVRVTTAFSEENPGDHGIHQPDQAGHAEYDQECQREHAVGRDPLRKNDAQRRKCPHHHQGYRGGNPGGAKG